MIKVSEFVTTVATKRFKSIYQNVAHRFVGAKFRFNGQNRFDRLKIMVILNISRTTYLDGLISCESQSHQTKPGERCSVLTFVIICIHL